MFLKVVLMTSNHIPLFCFFLEIKYLYYLYLIFDFLANKQQEHLMNICRRTWNNAGSFFASY